MQINLMTIEQHAGEKLRRIERAETAGERLEGLRKFLKIESERLRLRHRFGLGGMEIVRARSLIVDLLISSSAEAASSEGQAEGGKKELSIIALGSIVYAVSPKRRGVGLRSRGDRRSGGGARV